MCVDPECRTCSCHPSGAQNFEKAPRFLGNLHIAAFSSLKQNKTNTWNL